MPKGNLKEWLGLGCGTTTKERSQGVKVGQRAIDGDSAAELTHKNILVAVIPLPAFLR